MTEPEINLILRNIGACENCGSTDGTELRNSMTAYHFDGPIESDDNPNRRWMGCATCWEEYHAHWQSMWDEYNASRY